MELKIFTKKINRKSFFAASGLTAAGFIVMRTFPFNLLNKQIHESVKVEINPQAISRKKAGEKNG